MTLNASKVKYIEDPNKPQVDKVEQPLLDVGTHSARLVQVIDLGLHARDAWQGVEKPPAYKIYLVYELSEEFMVDEEGNELKNKPLFKQEEMNFFSLDSETAKSTERYMSLDPTKEHGGDWSKLLGTPCEVTIVHKPGTGKHTGKTFANIGHVATMSAKRAANLPELVNPPKFLSLDDTSDNAVEFYKSLPSFLSEKIEKGLEWKGCPLHKALGGEVPAKGVEETTDDEVKW